MTAAGSSPKEVAAHTGVHIDTVYRWLASAEVKRRVETMLAAQEATARNVLRTNAVKIATGLVEMATDDSGITPPAVRLSATKDALDRMGIGTEHASQGSTINVTVADGIKAAYGITIQTKSEKPEPDE